MSKERSVTEIKFRVVTSKGRTSYNIAWSNQLQGFDTKDEALEYLDAHLKSILESDRISRLEQSE
jgi:hypothetical protein